MRSVIEALRTGWRLLWRSKRLWAVVWILHLAGGMALAISFAAVWDDVLGNRAAAELGGPGTAGLLVDLSAHHGEALDRLLGSAGLGWLRGGGIGGMALLFVWLGAVLAGGIVSRLSVSLAALQEEVRAGAGAPRAPVEERSGSFVAALLGDCGLYLGRMTRLLVVQLVAALAVLWATVVAAGLVFAVFLGAHPDQRTVSRAVLVVLPVLSLLWFVLVLIGDYARIRMVRERRLSALLAWWAGLRWALRRLPATLALHLTFVVLAVLLTVAYWVLAPSASASSTALFALLVALQQAYLVGRGGLRVWWYASELALWERGRAAGIDAVAVVEEGRGCPRARERRPARV